MTDEELLWQIKMGRVWINKGRKTRWSFGLMRYFLQQDNPWPVAVEYLDILMARLENLLEEKNADRS